MEQSSRSVADVVMEALAQRIGKKAKITDLAMDSLDMVTAVTDLEEKYNIEIPDVDVDRLYKGTVGEFVEYVKGRTRGGDASDIAST